MIECEGQLGLQDQPDEDLRYRTTSTRTSPTPKRPWSTSNACEETELDADFIEAMAANEDADALTIQNFKEELEGFMQETPDLILAYSGYYAARQRLLQQKKKSTTFWPLSKRTSKKLGALARANPRAKAASVPSMRRTRSLKS